jgi:hypothetical protein
VGANLSGQIKEEPLHDRTTKPGPFRSRHCSFTLLGSQSLQVPHRRRDWRSSRRSLPEVDFDPAVPRPTLIAATLTAPQ